MAARRPCWQNAVWLIVVLGLVCGWRVSFADTTPTLFSSFSGRVNFLGTQKTLRTQSDAGNSCAIDSGTTTAVLAGLPAGATIRAAYLYWAGSGSAPDYSVTFEGGTVNAAAARSYTATFTTGGTNYDYFSGAANVTGTVAAKGNGAYSFTGLAVDNGNPWCGSSAVLGGWALLVIYSHPSEDFRVINVYEGFQHFRGSAITLTPSNFQIPVSPINGKDAHLTWEGDVGNSAPLGGFNEELTFNGSTLTDASNPANNQFNSVSTINAPADANSFGVDFDVYDVTAYLSAGQTSATTVYSSGGDLVLLSAQIISTTNVDVADLEITMSRNGPLTPNQNASYTLDVINNGPLSEPGPVRITNTLPAGLSYVSGAGSGWTCSVPVADVICDYSGSLASGASAPALSLTVFVSPAASGMVTNTAGVSGQAFDNISWNNTASDSFYILPATYAYYAMDEASWGAVTDSSGYGRDGAVMGAATPTDYPPPSPPDSAIAGNPGTCGSGRFPVTAGSGVDTGVDINSLGNAGSITLWYSSNTVWNDGTDRMLLDASNNLGNNNADKHFFLVKGDGGEIRFGLEDDADDNELISSGGNSFAANQWHHIAITWDWNTSNRMRLYLDGVEVANTGINDNIGNYATLYLGTTHAGIGGTGGGGSDFTTNTANGYIDEVRLYDTALSAADVAAIRDLTHPCTLPLDHIQIEHPGGSGLTCNPSTITLRACSDAGCTAEYTGGVTGSLTAAGSPTVNWVGGTGFTIAAGSSTVTKDFQVTTPGSVVLGTSGENPVPSGTSPTCDFGAPSCTFTAADSGFVFDVPDHVADTIQNVTLAAVRKDDATQKCVPAFQSVTRSVNFWSSYINPNSGTLAVNLNGANIAGAGPGTSRSLNFNVNGETTLQVRYPDVGQMRLNAGHSGSGTSAGLSMTGVDDFVTKPSRFVLGIAGNPAAADASGGVFKHAGENFPITVEARNANDALTPNYGRESSPETVSLTRTLVAPLGGNNPAHSGSFGAFGLDCSGGPGTAGIACGSFNWPEVGIISFTPGIGDGDYLGAGNVSVTASGNIGRFIPAYFDVTRSHGCGSFTYSGQPLALVTATARAVSGNKTDNYHNFGGGVVFSKDTTISDAGSTANFSNYVMAATDFVNGIQNKIDVTYLFPDKITPPATLALRAVDTDLVSSAGHTEENAEIRSGRLHLLNAYGSELLTLSMPMKAEYYEDTAGPPATMGWIVNGADTCTALAAGQLDLQNDIDDPALGVSSIMIQPGLSSNVTVVSPAAGAGELSFSAPGDGGDGFADARVDLTGLPWLQFDWDGSGDTDPVGRATFGLYRGSPRHIYLRQRYN